MPRRFSGPHRLFVRTKSTVTRNQHNGHPHRCVTMVCRRAGLLKVTAAFYCLLCLLFGFKIMQVPLSSEPGSLVLHDRQKHVLLTTPYLNIVIVPPGELLAVPEKQLWFHETLVNADMWDTSRGDRILEQLAHMRALPQKRPEVLTKPPKLVYSMMSHWDPPDLFKKAGCPVHNCILSRDQDDGPKADAVMFNINSLPTFEKAPNQVWIFHHLENPRNTGPFSVKDQVNWTATYRSDSTIVTPYEKFVPYNPQIQGIEQAKNYSDGKTKMVAWFVSNCNARNNRLNYAKELGKFVSVDIYGRCGTLRCPRKKASDCFRKLNKDYKFYLSFENHNCRSYITEKFYWNGLWNDVIPIVMGAHPDDYRQVAPPHSYIHVEDFPTPKALAEYLEYLDRNHTAYNEYFQWKGTGTFINTHFMCRVCAMLHERPPDQHSWIPDINEWWGGNHVCRTGRWDERRFMWPSVFL